MRATAGLRASARGRPGPQGSPVPGPPRRRAGPPRLRGHAESLEAQPNGAKVLVPRIRDAQRRARNRRHANEVNRPRCDPGPTRCRTRPDKRMACRARSWCSLPIPSMSAPSATRNRARSCTCGSLAALRKTVVRLPRRQRPSRRFRWQSRWARPENVGRRAGSWRGGESRRRLWLSPRVARAPGNAYPRGGAR